jgi:CMP-N,N'-diacetyllegionaminic acid synthase
MYKNKKIIALIIARKNSKGLKNKHLLKLNGKKIIEWTFSEANQSKYVDEVMLSTDSDKIIKISKKYNISAPFKRPFKYSKDTSKIGDVINHAKKFLKEHHNDDYDLLVLLQGSSPFRKSHHIDGAIKYFLKNDKKANTLASGFKIPKKYSWILEKKNNYINFSLSQNTKNFRRQANKDLYLPNGAIFISNFNDKFTTFYKKQTLFYEMKAHESVDIDTIQDYLEAQKYLKFKQ